METTVIITGRKLETWKANWPCSTLRTGWLRLASNGDIVDMGGRIAGADVDAHELNAFLEDYAGPERP